MEKAKQCTKCGVTKPLSSFGRDKNRRDGARSRCKQCLAELERLRYGNNRLQYQFKYLLARSKERAKDKNLPHDIDIDYLRSIATEYCPYQGVKLRWADESADIEFGAHSPNSPSIDRIDSSKGYVRGNVVIVSHRANSIKNNATEQELIDMGRRIARLKMEMAMPE